jgi:hypothetical protein
MKRQFFARSGKLQWRGAFKNLDEAAILGRKRRDRVARSRLIVSIKP